MEKRLNYNIFIIFIIIVKVSLFQLSSEYKTVTICNVATKLLMFFVKFKQHKTAEDYHVV